MHTAIPTHSTRLAGKASQLLAHAVFAVLAAAPLCALAESGQGDFSEMSLEELMEMRVEHVVGASRYEQKVTRAPASVTVVTAEEIRRHGHRTLADVLRGVRSLYVWNDRNYTYLGARGFLRPGDYDTRVLVLIDGHRINDNLFDSGTIAREGMIEVELIDRVEVIRGPGSSMYGSSAFLGVINIITKRGGDFGGFELAADAEPHDTHRTRASYGEKFDNGLEVLLSGSHFASDGTTSIYYREFDQRVSDDPRARNDGLVNGLDDEAAWTVFGSASYGDFTVSGFYVDRTKDVPTAPFGTAFGERTWTADYRSYLDVRYDHRFSDDVSLHGNVYVDEYRYKGVYPYDYAEEGQPEYIVNLLDGAVGRWLGSDLRLSARLRDRHTLLFGAEFRDNLREYQYSYEAYEEGPNYLLVDDRTSHVTSVFAQGEFELSRKIVLIGGLRYDYYSQTFGGHLSPRVSVIFSPTETAVLKALYGHAFRAPNPFELYYNIAQHDRPTLQPEAIDTYELVYEHHVSKALRFAVSAYHYEIDDLVSQNLIDEVYYYDNLARTRARGVEVEVAGVFSSGAAVTASYGLQRSLDVGSGLELSSSPRHLAKLNLSAPLWSRDTVAGFELQYQSKSYTLAEAEADAFAVANLSLTSRALWPGLEASIGVYNLFNERYGYPGAADHAQDVLEQDRRTYRGSLTYRF